MAAGPLIVVGAKAVGAIAPETRRKWTDLESRLAASIVYVTLRDSAHRQLDRQLLVERCGLTTEEVMHALIWMRLKGVDVRVTPHPMYESSLITLVLPDAP